MAVPNANEFHWQSLARLSSGRVYHSLSEVGEQMYMLGGCDAAGRPCPSLELYSPESDRWISLSPMPTPRAGAAVAVLGKQILVVGGVGEDQSPLKVVEMYNIEDGRWRKRSALREALMGVSITVKDGRALAVGGMGADLLPRSILQQYDLRKDVWALLPPMPTPRYDANTHLLGNKLYVAGGRQCKRPVKAFEMYDTETRSWTSLPILPCKRTYGGVIWDSYGRLCLLGGLRQGGGHQSSKFTKNVNIFDTNQGTETKLYYNRSSLISYLLHIYMSFVCLYVAIVAVKNNLTLLLYVSDTVPRIAGISILSKNTFPICQQILDFTSDI
uniref:Kelch domain containing 8A n=1 Tax=Kryptolebias marmoratus TaxID=37003 RepID=A0A3Q3BBJ3_KRYMA